MNLSLPAPEFFDQVEHLSTKKARGTPRQKPPPKPPLKSAPAVGRFLHNFAQAPLKAHAVSFNENLENSTLSKHYNEKSVKTYFYQCFRIVNKLGAGSFGEVFKVQNVEDKKFYAVKKSREPFRGELDRLLKLEEVKKHEQLPSHPNCIQFVKAWEERQHLYIQTELCLMSLSDFAEQNNDIPEKLIWKYLVDLLMAVKHLHDHNLVHMDMKPDNIFISRDGVCKLGDFGLVLDLSKEDLSEAIEGDPKYLAPELLEGKFTKAADIFSLGITILELACDLDLPRGGSAWQDLRHGELPVEFTKHLSKDLIHVIRQMMMADYKRRPSVDKLLSFEAVGRVLRRRRCEMFFKHVVFQVGVIADVALATAAFFQFILLWPWRTYRSLADGGKAFKDTPDRHSSEMECSFSDDDDFKLHQVSDIFNDSVPNFDNRLAHSTPVLVRNRNLPFTSWLSSRHDLSSALQPRSPGSPTFDRLNDSSDEERHRSEILPRNLTEMFDSISDED